MSRADTNNSENRFRNLYLFQNGASDAEYRKAEESLNQIGLYEGEDYETVSSADVFDSKPWKGEVTLGVETSIGVINHQGVESIEEAAKALDKT